MIPADTVTLRSARLNRTCQHQSPKRHTPCTRPAVWEIRGADNHGIDVCAAHLHDDLGPYLWAATEASGLAPR